MNDMQVERNSESSVARNLIESVLGDVKWASPTLGYCFCPGGDQHTNGKNDQDALVRFDDSGVPFVFCFHSSCRSRQNQANSELKALFNSNGLIEKKPKSERDKAEELKSKQLRHVKWLARYRVLPELMKYPVPLDEWQAASPFPVGSLSHQEQSRAFISGLFRPHPDNILCLPPNPLWCGDPYQTGEDWVDRFRSREKWLASSDYGQQFGTAEFRHGTVDRKRENVLLPILTILESDIMTPEQFGSVIRYAQKYSMLRSIVHTGNKGVHAGFDPLFDTDLFAILEGLGCDRNVLRYGLSTRLPGVERKDDEGQPTGRYQRLLYLNPRHKVVI